MSYIDDKGKYQKAYHFLYKKLVPLRGTARNELGEVLRIVSKIYFRLTNDGDSYDDCIDNGLVEDLSKKKYPFDKEYHDLGKELDKLLSNKKYDDAINLVLVHIMLSLSSDTKIYSPNTNRLVPMDSLAGKNAFKLLNLNSIFINYCGKNEDWLPISLRREGVKITKLLSEETKKELKCDTIQQVYQDSSSTKFTLPKDNTILSKKFINIKREHQKSIRENIRKRKLLTKKREQNNKIKSRRRIKNFNKTKLFYEQLKDITENKRIEVFKKLRKAKITHNSLIEMFLVTLIEYKEKKVTSKLQREHKKKIITKLVNALKKSGGEIVRKLENKENSYGKNDSLYSSDVSLSDNLDKEMEDMLIDILGGVEALENLYYKCCR